MVGKESWKNTNKASVTGKTKAETMRKTIELAKTQGNSSVIIHKTNGKIQEDTRFKFEKKNKKDYNRQRHKAYFDATPPIQVCLFKKTSMGRKEYDVVYPYEYCSTMLY